VLEKIVGDLELPDQVFGSQVRNLTLNEVNLINFSSKPFVGLTEASDVIIDNSKITATK
jgi:hypothetical protein